MMFAGIRRKKDVRITVGRSDPGAIHADSRRRLFSRMEFLIFYHIHQRLSAFWLEVRCLIVVSFCLELGVQRTAPGRRMRNAIWVLGEGKRYEKNHHEYNSHGSSPLAWAAAECHRSRTARLSLQ